MAQIHYKEKSFAGRTLRVYKLDPLTATDVFIDLMKLAAPSLGAAAVAASQSENGVKKLLDGIGDDIKLAGGVERAFTGLIDRITKEKVRELIAHMMTATRVVVGPHEEPKLEQGLFDVIFTGKIGDMFQWLAFAVGVQYDDFFAKMAPVIKGAVRQAMSLQGSSKSPDDSGATPTSGG